MRTTPLTRAVEHLRGQGYVCEVVRRHSKKNRRRVLLLGAFDLVCVRGGQVLGVALTAAAFGEGERTRRRLQGDPLVGAWTAAGSRAEVHAWHKRGGRWHVTVLPVTPDPPAADGD